VEPVGDAYRHLDDYEHGMAAYRNADALDRKKPPLNPNRHPTTGYAFHPLRRHFHTTGIGFRTHGHAGTGPATRVNYALRDLPADNLPIMDDQAQ